MTSKFARTASPLVIAGSLAAILAFAAVPADARGAGAAGGMRTVGAGATTAGATAGRAAAVRTAANVLHGTSFGGGGSEQIPPSTYSAISQINEYIPGLTSGLAR